MAHKVIRILGIDPGLRFTGWGMIDVEGSRLQHVANGTVKSDSAMTLAARLVQIHKGLMEVMSAYDPHEAAVENTFVNKDAAATLKLGQARGIALLVPALAGLAVAEYAPNHVKKSVVGVGHADKHQIKAMIGILLPTAKLDSADSADALAVAITHAHHRGQRVLQPAKRKMGA
jgi:crossover junction endodeoxyribonuclease RuvC